MAPAIRCSVSACGIAKRPVPSAAPTASASDQWKRRVGRSQMGTSSRLGWGFGSLTERACGRAGSADIGRMQHGGPSVA